MKRRNTDTKTVKAVSLVIMSILFLLLAYNIIFNAEVLLALPTVGLVAYLLGTVFTELGLYGVLELMNSIEDAREE
ncbi:hypothetical protein [Coprococcus aceti]|jgi:hypothetical protein|uniref:hypothetical protein n=1 Tax=Coprococcus aceti TaxID=2981786 RepID=UPI0022E6C9CD|nr:hypothetical protein [Coprococcus aceti]